MDKDLIQGAAVGDLRKVQVCSFCASPKQQKRTKTLKKIREGRKYFFDMLRIKVSARVLFGVVSLVVPHLVVVALVGLCLHPRDRFL